MDQHLDHGHTGIKGWMAIGSIRPPPEAAIGRRWPAVKYRLLHRQALRTRPLQPPTSPKSVVDPKKDRLAYPADFLKLYSNYFYFNFSVYY